ncbi:MAG: PepSY domain-containing protein [Hyphomicrobium sp.]|uniref:PepSY domain-containing protein n=1 Tax=Hyphomicrobium sp. TaxID=82 RepID=UPI003D0FC62C
MIRAISLAAALAVGASLPALATEAGSAPAFKQVFTEVQARQHLMHLGYSEVSELSKDEDGKWVGTATKDGQKRIVAVDIKRPVAEGSQPTN